VGHYLKALAPQWALLDAALPIRAGGSNSDVLRSYLSLLVQGKRGFDAVEGYRGDKFFKAALGIGLLLSSRTYSASPHGRVRCEPVSQPSSP